MNRIWQARCFYLYGRYDMAWTTIQKALVIRQYIGGLTPMMELVPLAALILLAKIGAIAHARRSRKQSLAALKVKQQQSLHELFQSSTSSLHSAPPSPLGSIGTPTNESKYVAPLSQEEADAALAAVLQRHAERYAVEEVKLVEWWAMVNEFYREIQTWRTSQEANFGHMALLVSAEMARFRGKNLKAMTLYNQAIDAAKEGEWHYHEALCCERVGLLYLSRKDQHVAGFWLRRSLQSYRIWGARRVKQLKQQFHRLLDIRDMPAETKAAAEDAPIIARFSPQVSGRGSTGSGASVSTGVIAGVRRSNSVNSSGSGSQESVNLGTGIGNTTAANIAAVGKHSNGSPATSITQSFGNTTGSPGGVDSSHGGRTNQGSSGEPNAAIAMWRARSLQQSPAGLLHGPASRTAALNTSTSIDELTNGPMMRSNSRSDTTYAPAGGLGSNPWSSGPIPSFGSSALNGDTLGTHGSGVNMGRGMGKGMGRGMGGKMNNNNNGNGTFGSTSGVHDITNSQGGNDTIDNNRNQLHNMSSNPGTSSSPVGTMDPNHSRYFRSMGQGVGPNQINTGTFGSGMISRPQHPNIGNGSHRGGNVNSNGHGRGVNAQIDAQSMLDAAQAMSQEMQLDRALMSLLTTLLTCAGAESGLLISKRANKWVVEARANSNGCEVLPSEGEIESRFPLPRGFGPRGFGVPPDYDANSTVGSAFSGYGGGAGLGAASRYIHGSPPAAAAAVDASNTPFRSG
jgi:hypothetical protein